MIIPSEIQNQLCQAFALTASGQNDNIRQGTHILMSLRQDILYPKVLLDFFTSNTEPQSALRACIEFKLWFNNYKDFAEYEYQVVSSTVEVIKQQIIQVYLISGRQLASMIQEAIVNIAARDFPLNWQNLMPQLISVLNVNQFTLDQILRVLKLCRKIFNKYEYSSRSDPLYLEIIHVCDTIHATFLGLTTFVVQSIQSQQGDLALLYKVLKSLLRIFYYLNYQDLHPNFEDNLETWMQIMQAVLKLEGSDPAIFKCKGEALRSVLLYSTKYRDDFQSLIQVFSQEIWAVCTSVHENDAIIHNALRYFRSLVSWQDMKQFFQSNIDSLMTNLIVKYLNISKNDLLCFNEESQQFMEIFFEHSDMESRRSQTIELYKNLIKYYPQQVQQILTTSVQSYIQQVQANQIDFNNEILLINLLIDGLVVAYTSKDGAIDLSLHQSLPITFYEHVLKTRLGNLYQLGQQSAPVDTAINPLTLAFYCRFIFVFKNFIPHSELLSIAQVISKCALAKHPTLARIACYTVEALLTTKQGDIKSFSNLQPLFTPENVGDQLNPILADLYQFAKSTQEIYSLRAINVVLGLMKHQAQANVDALCVMFNNQLNTLNDGFDFQMAHLVFECIATFLASANRESALIFSSQVVSTLDKMLRANKGDISAFILQIYSLLVRILDKQHHEYFGQIFQSFMMVENWVETNVGLFPAYIQYFEGWLQQNPLNQAEDFGLQNILGITIAISVTSFIQLTEVLINLPYPVPWLIPTVIKLVFHQYSSQQFAPPPQSVGKNRQTQSITQKTINKHVFIILALIVQKIGTIPMIEECEAIQPGFLEQFLMQEHIIVKSINIRLERRQVFVLITLLLFGSNFKLSQNCWTVLFQSVIENLGQKHRGNAKNLRFNAIQPQITNSSGYQRLQALTNLSEKQNQIVNEEKFFAGHFKDFYARLNPNEQQSISSLLNVQQQELLTSIIQSV